PWSRSAPSASGIRRSARGWALPWSCRPRRSSVSRPEKINRVGGDDRAASVQPVAFALLQQILAADAHDSRGLRLLAAGEVEYLGDVGALELCERHLVAVVARVADVGRQGVEGNLSGRGRNQRALQHVPQFADVPGKGVALENCQCVS